MLTTKQVSGLKIFLDTKRCVKVDTFVDVIDKVCSIDEDDAVFVLFIVDDDNVSDELSIILISVDTVNGRVVFSDE